MRKISFALLLLVLAGGGAIAQPGPDPQPYPPAPQPYPQPQPQPQPQPPPGYGPQGYAPPQHHVPVQLSADDAALLQQGEISEGAHIGGGVAALFFGFGVGQAVQGRYSETGWIFTLGEAASMALSIYGLIESLENSCFGTIEDPDCLNGNRNNNNNGEIALVGGLVGILVFRVWEVVDAFGGPTKHNRRVRELRMRLGMPVPMYTQKVVPFVNKTRDGGATAGFTFRF